MIVITARRMSGGHGHEHVTSVRWQDTDSDDEGESTVTAVAEWIDAGVEVRVNDTAAPIVETVRRRRGNPLIRSRVDGRYTNNLLRLPLF